jgi:segregation and condensation protein A
MTPKVAPTVGLEHLHAPAVSVREQATIVGHRLRRERSCSFRSLVADADNTLVIVARFLALLELFREAAIAFEQAEALGELTVRWTGSDEGEIEVSDEFDEDESDQDERNENQRDENDRDVTQQDDVPHEGQESSDD